MTDDALLCIHGAGGRGLVWQHQALAFPRARTPDLAGRAGGAPDRVDVHVETLRRAFPGGPWVLVGHSLGSAIALLWALEHPDDVRGLVLVGAGAKMRVNPVWLEGLARRDRAALEEFGAAWFGPTAGARLRDKSLALLRATPPDVLLADLHAADRFDVTDRLDRLAVPTLVLCGADDRLTPPKFSRYLHERIAGSVLEIVPDAGHMVMLEQPHTVNAAIRRFLRRLNERHDGGTA
ncbi:MAG: alpha/beta hydrolase [Armatimonadota bacterium]|nr:alpha/beta hydrolase [Armatimonadota bacterium]